MELTRPAWIEIDLDKLIRNINKIKENINEGTEIISVVKSNAYGFGEETIVECLIDEGIKFFAVATITEAIKLRSKFKDIKILVLSYTPDYLFDRAITEDIILSTYDYNQAKALNELAIKKGVITKIHIAVDTGMNRIGFKVNKKSQEEIKDIYNLSNLKIEGIFSHFAVADTDRDYTEKQFNKFMEMDKGLKALGIEIPIRHICNSQGVLNYKEYNLESVRPGIIQYGSPEGVKSKYEGFELEFIGEIKAQIALVKEIKKGDKVSYGLTFTANEDMKIATVPIGYSDGIIRQLSGKIDVLIDGKRCRQIGRICMDQFMVDVTGVDCKMGDEAVIVGKQGNEFIEIDELANMADEIVTSFCTHLSPRLPKLYLKNNKPFRLIDDIIEYRKEF